MSWKSFCGLALLCAAGAAAYAWHAGVLVLPDRWNPWAPLAIAEQPNLLTRLKLGRLSGDDLLCQTVLASAKMRYQPVPDRRTGADCGLNNAVRVHETSVRVSSPFLVSCRTAVSLALWEYHVLQPAAQAAFGEEVRRIEHYGSYACRNIYGRERGRRSRHATADAFDIAGFVLADGRRIRVATDWGKEGAKAEFLRVLHRGACRFFDGVLGPDYNRAHTDHFHFDRGAFRICR